VLTLSAQVKATASYVRFEKINGECRYSASSTIICRLNFSPVNNSIETRLFVTLQAIEDYLSIPTQPLLHLSLSQFPFFSKMPIRISHLEDVAIFGLGVFFLQ
jgi:hypothetical protein